MFAKHEAFKRRVVDAFVRSQVSRATALGVSMAASEGVLSGLRAADPCAFDPSTWCDGETKALWGNYDVKPRGISAKLNASPMLNTQTRGLLKPLFDYLIAPDCPDDEDFGCQQLADAYMKADANLGDIQLEYDTALQEMAADSADNSEAVAVWILLIYGDGGLKDQLDEAITNQQFLASQLDKFNCWYLVYP
jgi:hypothetical protein